MLRRSQATPRERAGPDPTILVPPPLCPSCVGAPLVYTLRVYHKLLPQVDSLAQAVLGVGLLMLTVLPTRCLVLGC